MWPPPENHLLVLLMPGRGCLLTTASGAPAFFFAHSIGGSDAGLTLGFREAAGLELSLSDARVDFAAVASAARPAMVVADPAFLTIAAIARLKLAMFPNSDRGKRELIGKY